MERVSQKQYEYEKVADAIHLLGQNWKSQPSLGEIAEQVHMSPFHFQRMFTEWAGVSPKKFLQYLTVSYTKRRLQERKDSSLIATAEEAGLSSSSRLHDLFMSIEGMTPGEYKNGGAQLRIRYSVQKSQFGEFLVASTEKGICHLHFFEDMSNALKEFEHLWPAANIVEDVDHFHEQVIRFFQHGLSLKEKIRLHVCGTNFQIKVWEALLKIPQGSLSSYGHIAYQLQNPKASRAVGSAIASNPVAFLIPCHRVIQQAGNIGEFRWGTVRKKAMIGWEASQLKMDS